jgi:hypothetical protein
MTTFILITASLYVLVIGGFIVYAFHKGWTPWIRERRLPVERVLADAEQKEVHHEYMAMLQREEVSARLIAFRCQDGQTRVYSVDERVFDRVAEGDHGILLYRGESFVAFESAKSGADSEEVYRRVVR